MATAKLFAATGDFKNDIQLPALFDEEVNKVCMYLHIKAILNNNRQGTAQTKNKSSVSGGGQKPWKQKGTGRARSGQNTSAVWVRGAKKIAFHSALASKAQEGKFFVFEALSFGAPKTKDLLSVLAKSGIEQRNVLFITSGADTNLYLSSNNIPWCRCARVEDVNTYDVIRANNVVVSQAALNELEGGR